MSKKEEKYRREKKIGKWTILLKKLVAGEYYQVHIKIVNKKGRAIGGTVRLRYSNFGEALDTYKSIKNMDDVMSYQWKLYH